MQFVFPPSATVAVPVAASKNLFPVHRVYCVGRNYAEHAKEMSGNDREAPFFFMKPADAVLPVPAGTVGELRYPSMTQDLHHEIELVVAIGTGGKNIAAADASEHIWGYAIGLDMTRRDLQAEAKKAGRPWCTGKGFDQSAPLGPIYPVQATGQLHQAAIGLRVNGELRQQGNVAQLIWNVPETIEYLSQYFELQAVDLIFTGTPAGVAAVVPGDLMEATIDGLGELKLRVLPA